MPVNKKLNPMLNKNYSSRISKFKDVLKLDVHFPLHNPDRSTRVYGAFSFKKILGDLDGIYHEYWIPKYIQKNHVACISKYICRGRTGGADRRFSSIRNRLTIGKK
jgi:hypothetical protein